MIQLQSEFSKNISDENILTEYPRPTLERSSWLNLNGLWQYAVTKDESIPQQFDGQILVPFSPEAALSRVCRSIGPDDYLWYKRTLTADRPSQGMRLLLHFGAVDQYALVYINRIQAGSHQGGYLPFTLDITDFLFSGDNELLVMVRDETGASHHSRGKQSLKPGGMFYTAQSGIWQTVWAETVPDNYMESVLLSPDYDGARLTVHITTAINAPFSCTITGEGIKPLYASGMTNEAVTIALPDFHPWSTEDPYLYQISLRTGTDRAKSYFAMRKCDIQTGADGKRRFFLNDRPFFQAGVLDQGYWPESLYTAPSDEAFIADIRRMKKLGFNMLRKHAKIEPERFYYHCDRIGMLVWQDFVNGGARYKHWFVTYLATLMNWNHISFSDGERHRRLLSRMDKEGHREFLQEMRDTVSFLRQHPCIVVWVPFNEGWGQFDALETAKALKALDPDRLIDHASGWFDQGGGDIVSLHYYFLKLKFSAEEERALALTEYGGYSCSIKGHSACDKEYGYRKYKTTQALTAGYADLMERTILPAVKDGIGAVVYTQLSDIEEETNGIYTYDRAVCKLDPETVRKYNRLLKEAGSI